MIKIKKSNNKYLTKFVEIIDTEYKGRDLLALTKNNAEFILAVINIDSNYRNNEKIINKKIQILKNSKDIKKDLLELIKEVNRTHSTRAKIESIEEIAERISKVYPSYKALEKGLDKDFESSDKEHFISLFTKPTNGKCNLSLASKVAHALKKDKYPKYDNVVASNIGDYLKIYLGDSKKKFKVNNDSKDKYNDYLVVYENYVKSIRELVNCPEVAKHNLDFEKIDGIIWYSKKGNKSRIP